MSRQIRRRPQAEADLTDQFVYYLTNAGHEVAELRTVSAPFANGQPREAKEAPA